MLLGLLCHLLEEYNQYMSEINLVEIVSAGLLGVRNWSYVLLFQAPVILLLRDVEQDYIMCLRFERVAFDEKKVGFLCSAVGIEWLYLVKHDLTCNNHPQQSCVFTYLKIDVKI